MAIAVLMPKQGQSVESCLIIKWNKKVGDKMNFSLFSTNWYQQKRME